MKIHPNGTVEGSPAECADYTRIKHEQSHLKPFKDVKPLDDDFIKRMRSVVHEGKCPNAGQPCFCTGACLRPKEQSDYSKSPGTLYSI